MKLIRDETCKALIAKNSILTKFSKLVLQILNTIYKYQNGLYKASAISASDKHLRRGAVPVWGACKPSPFAGGLNYPPQVFIVIQ
jgi:hypothetical protein